MGMQHELQERGSRPGTAEDEDRPLGAPYFVAAAATAGNRNSRTALSMYRGIPQRETSLPPQPLDSRLPPDG
jgi:hypothetical protein